MSCLYIKKKHYQSPSKTPIFLTGAAGRGSGAGDNAHVAGGVMPGHGWPGLLPPWLQEATRIQGEFEDLECSGAKKSEDLSGTPRH